MNRIACILVALAVGSVASAYGSVITFNVLMDGPQAQTSSPATGPAIVTVDDIANSVSVDLSFSGLIGVTTTAHIHCCAPPGSDAPPVIFFVPAGFPLGVHDGSFRQTFTGLSDAVIAQVVSGEAYINIHTDAHPMGEIRGNLVPEPGTLALLGAGLAGLLAVRKRGRS